ncbi:MAG TPA: signal peptide peptidase SppA [Campylobacterales bacterium]|nr:signal peptide peptidase SppA [Campylobacterales bacterium]
MNEIVSRAFWPITAPISFIQNNFKALLFLLIVFVIFYSSSEDKITHPNLAKVYISGPIMSADKFLEDIKEIEDAKVKGLLVIVDSPGGAVAPSVEMALTIKRLKAKIPVVTYAAGTMASGSYYASIWSNKIIANPGSAIGSIGVLFEGANVEGLMKKLGVESQVIKAGEYKEAGTMFRKWTPKEREQIGSLIDDTYKMFTEDVASARGLDINKTDSFANAKVFTARLAQKAGLVDELGTRRDAETALAKLANVKEPVWLEKTKMNQFLERLVAETASKLAVSFSGLKAY